MRGTENLNAIDIGKGANDGRVSNLKRIMHNCQAQGQGQSQIQSQSQK